MTVNKCIHWDRLPVGGPLDSPTFNRPRNNNVLADGAWSQCKLTGKACLSKCSSYAENRRAQVLDETDVA